ncbi:MAG TPA: hypothetical protein VHC72_14815 [Bryobacteraceae bacterium]|nr:hypothetical protein [Bryobacteraceae bacterium]
MRIRGINYDTGFISQGTTTREPFDPEVVRREMQIIRNDLGCNGVRITGGYAERLEIAAASAAEAGLEVWFCPFTHNLTADEVLALLADCAERAERLRRKGAEIVFLTGSELSLVTNGFLPGDTLPEKLTVLSDPVRVRQIIPEMRVRMKELLRNAVDVVRARFGGKISYASLPFEGVDWNLFDIIATDAGYRTAARAALFRDDIRAFVSQGRALGKPVAVTEFGCATHRGASTLADREESIIEWGEDARPVRLRVELTRDEDEQATYIGELLDVFESEGVDCAFVYTLARYDFCGEFDPISKGIVKVLDKGRGNRYPDMPWEPKAAFDALAERYRAQSGRL